MNKTNKERCLDMNYRLVVTMGYGMERRREKSRVKETERGERGVSAEAATRCDVTCGRDRVPAGHAPSPPAHRSRRDLPSFVVWRELSIFRQNKS